MTKEKHFLSFLVYVTGFLMMMIAILDGSTVGSSVVETSALTSFNILLFLAVREALLC